MRSGWTSRRTFSSIILSLYYEVEPFTDLTFPKENILPEEKKNSLILGLAIQVLEK